MNIKDFKAGQTAYGLTIRNISYQGAGRNERKECVDEYTVQKVGKKFVYVSRNPGSYAERFEMRRDYAIKDNGFHCDDVRLFPSLEAINDWKELEQLRRKIHSACNYGAINRYTLEQLRTVWAILEGENAT